MSKKVIRKSKRQIKLNNAYRRFIVGVLFVLPRNFRVEVVWDEELWILLQIVWGC